MSDATPRGERIGWTLADVVKGEVGLLQVHLSDEVDKLLIEDPLPYGCDLAYASLTYRLADSDKQDHLHEFGIMIDFNKETMSVFRLEGVKK